MSNKIHKQIVLVSVLLVTAVVCFFILKDTHNTALQKEIQSWVGYRFNFPEDVQLIYGEDSLLSRPYKILIYIDDAGCTGCDLRLRDWFNMYETGFNKVVPDQLSIIILFDGKEKDDILALVRGTKWSMPIFWDSDGAMNRERKFPKNTGMRCMLLDGDNRVLLVGNPVSSPDIYDLYLKILLT